MKKITLVTGLWDLGRNNLTSFKRSFDSYIECFKRLLSLDLNFIVYVPEELRQDVLLSRGHKNQTQVITRNLSEFKTQFPFYDCVQAIRTSSKWLDNQPSWLLESPQAQLPDYNPIVMSKMFVLNDATYHDGGSSDYYFWIDGGLTNTVSAGFLENLKHIGTFMEDKKDKLLFINYPYGDSYEIHGFKRDQLEQYCGKKVTSIPRGGFFGGSKDVINNFNGIYYQELGQTLSDGYMGTEESVFCILDAKYNAAIHNYMVEDNGLIWPFFDNLKNYKEAEPAIESAKTKKLNELETAIYILTFNSPKQVEVLLQSFELADPNFLIKPKIYLIDNSTKAETLPAYLELCKKYNMNHVKHDNIGICGGRQWAAEHFAESNADYYLFFEDDMLLHPPCRTTCWAGYDAYAQNLFQTSLEIIHLEQYDYLKLSYSEFYGNNKTQWAWYNISPDWRQHYFPDKPELPKHGLDVDAPLTMVKNHKTYKHIRYLEGEFHYCNWPIWMGKTGNKKVFLEKKYQYLYEQNWMAETFYNIKSGRIRCAVLSLSPINHHRFEHYSGEERKENPYA